MRSKASEKEGKGAIMEASRPVSPGRPNRLANEKSPYLLQHAYNPVDWLPWGEEAFRKAREEDKPIFLSIGYSTCHWCHVMAHESFEDEEVAEMLNRHYVSIKVDREERPDIDQLYMSVCQALTGRGGWPLSVFMTPEARPFFAGTYFPRSSRMGLMGFLELLGRIATLWREDRSRMLRTAQEITEAIRAGSRRSPGGHALDEGVLRKGFEQLARSYDMRWGGFGQAPKFPTPHQLTFLLRWYLRTREALSLEMVEKTLLAMRRGGIFDQIGYGFHRYSVDERWLVPHFEKMLYDQALLAMAYTEAFQVTGEQGYGRVVREIMTYVLRDMTSPEGGFYSAEDADSEGKEGLFYVWTPEEVVAHLGERSADIFGRVYDVRGRGNFEEGRSIPHLAVDLDLFASRLGLEAEALEEMLEGARRRLFEVRQRRVRPFRDDKILTSWNGLMVAAMAKAARALGEDLYRQAARRAARFVLSQMRRPDGRLLRRWRQAEAAHPGYLDDYAFLVWGLLELYEATLDASVLEEALGINQTMMELFWDQGEGGFYLASHENEALIARLKEDHDGATPSGNSVAALNLLRLGRMTGRAELEQRAEDLLETFAPEISAYPAAHCQFLIALDTLLGPYQRIVIAGERDDERTRAMISTVQKAFLPHGVLVLGEDDRPDAGLNAPLAEQTATVQAAQGPVVYICEGYACQRPITDQETLSAVISNLAQGKRLEPSSHEPATGGGSRAPNLASPASD